MTIIQRINKIQMLLKTADTGLLEKIEDLLEQGSSSDGASVLTDSQERVIDVRRERHLNGDSKSYSWQEIKQELIDKHGLQA